MQPISFLKRHLSLHTRPPTSTPKKRQKKRSPTPESPGYSSSSGTRSKTASPRSESKPLSPIKATNTPLHTWDNAKCRSWLYDLCITTLKCTPKEADAKVLLFTGNGKTLYQKDKDYWRLVFGNYNGLGVYSILLRIEPPQPEEMEKVGLLRKLRNSI
ncbi:unnamed protein product [Diplocarpon coronariae]|uniref:Uncharacterized protein n=1 Tax=Diplocarpon coronariae TaxID=2795749 RepID=A0A218Z7U3_9HELO|nr:hypothetical protein JHW43_003311 [Diplocarpon mali]OWP04137.1 hypothetical protein B2J93_5958 [Marssonina coronariae]